MITFLKGVLVESLPNRAAIDVNGVGYEVLIPLSSYDRLPEVGQTVQILSTGLKLLIMQPSSGRAWF